jgi:hypothetical protein
MSKYQPLKDFLQNTYKTTVVLTFQEIEEIIGNSLPDSASIHSAWWANDTTHHVHAKAWLEAGWLVESPAEAIRTHKVTFSRIIEWENTFEHSQSYTTLQEICAYFNCPYPCDEQEVKNAYWKMIMSNHPDKVNNMGEEIKKHAEEKTKEINDMYEKYQEAKSEELRKEQLEREERERRNQEKIEQERLEKERLNQEKIEQERLERARSNQSDYQPEPGWTYYDIDRETLRNSNSHPSEATNVIKALVITVALVIFFGWIVQSCPTPKKPDRPPSPRVEYVLPKTEGSSITVNSNILTEYFGISYEQRQKSNLFMKDAHEYRYNGNGTWTITKKSAVNNTNKNYIDTNNKNEVEDYLHGLGF